MPVLNACLGMQILILMVAGKTTVMPVHVVLFDDWSQLCSVLQAEHNAFIKLADLLLLAGKRWPPAHCIGGQAHELCWKKVLVACIHAQYMF